ncbi:conserved hypothetical protein [Flavobacterium sp. 9AF]|uniref:nucleotidyltransferase domain-containing protein n=1 Tax=Flavobacterium sp. 9AF TaxID=2653142 RepID=UPI0012F1FC86|nr:nucleotidyltransferase domain-containing protein [Flavobacterium sp. 9AF]VXB82556.1 conserved hypothetical protein [Flavobacterium sp. 9AF]
MSQVKMESIWQHELVLPYILNELRRKIEDITPVRKIVLYGSRARTPIENWEKLNGKDWDVVIICDFPITNTHIWTRDLNYHIDLLVTTQEKINHFEKRNVPLLELFPTNKLEITKIKTYGKHI